METRYPGFETIVFRIVTAELLGEQFLPAISFIRVGRMGVFLLERGDVGHGLERLGIDTCGAGEEEPGHSVEPAGLQHMGAYQDVVVG